jgi:hypothetical protein
MLHPFIFVVLLGVFFLDLCFSPRFIFFRVCPPIFRQNSLFSFCTDALNPTAMSHIFQRLRDLLVVFVLWSSDI